MTRQAYPILQATGAFDVTPDDADVHIEEAASNVKGYTGAFSLYVAGATTGDVGVTMADGENMIFQDVAPGTFLPILATHILLASTEVDQVVALAGTLTSK